MTPTYKNIILFIAPLLVALIVIFTVSGLDLIRWILSGVTAYGMMLLGWVLVEIFGD